MSRCIHCGRWHDPARAQALGSPKGYCSPLCVRLDTAKRGERFRTWWEKAKT